MAQTFRKDTSEERTEFRKREDTYLAQPKQSIPLSVDVNGGFDGFIVLLNVGNKLGDQQLRRTFVVDRSYIDGISFVPRSEGTVVVDYRGQAPSQQSLQEYFDALNALPQDVAGGRIRIVP